GATLQFGLVLTALLLWSAGERLIGRLMRPTLSQGGRGGRGDVPASLVGGLMVALFAVAGLALAGLALWSLSTRWRYPAVLPEGFTLANWMRHADSLAWPLWVTLTTAAATAAVALTLTLACL